MTSPDSPAPLADVPTHGLAGGSTASRVLHNTGMLAVASLAVRALGLGMVVVLARYLGAAGYGTYQRAEAFVFLFSIVINLGLDMILTREVARRAPKASEYLSGVVVLKLLLGPVCLGLILGLAYARGYQGYFLWGIYCYSAVLLLNAIGSAFDGVFQGLDSMGYTAIVNLVNQVVFVTLGLAFVLLHKDLRWILVAMVAASAVRLAVSSSLVTRLPVHWERPSLATLGYLLRQSIPIALAASFFTVYGQLDSVLLGDLKGNDHVGWYKASAKFLLFFTVLRDSFLVAIFPVFASAATSDRERMGRLMTQAVRYQMIVALYFVLCFVFLPRVVPKLLGIEFANTARVLPVMAWILVPQTISITLGRVLVATGNQKRNMVGTGLALLMNVALNLVLIPRYGYMGAAVTGATCEVAVAFVNWYFVHRYVAPTQILRAIARPMLAAALTGVALYLLPGVKLLLAFPLAALLYGAALLALRTFSTEELDRFAVLLREGRNRLESGLRRLRGGGGPGVSPGT